MNTDQHHPDTPAVFLQTVSVAVARLKQNLQRDYEQAYPDLREVVHLVLDQEEAEAWKLSVFPHLLLPDLVEAHIARLNLEPVKPEHDHVLVPHHFADILSYQPALALCG